MKEETGWASSVRFVGRRCGHAVSCLRIVQRRRVLFTEQFKQCYPEAFLLALEPLVSRLQRLLLEVQPGAWLKS